MVMATTTESESPHLSDRQSPDAEAQHGGNQIGSETYQAEPQRSEGEEKDGGNGEQHDDRPDQHGVDVALADIGEQGGGAGAVDARHMRRVFLQPGAGACVQFENFL